MERPTTLSGRDTIRIQATMITICIRARMGREAWATRRKLSRQFKMICSRQTLQILVEWMPTKTSASTKTRTRMETAAMDVTVPFTPCCQRVFSTHNFTRLLINLTASTLTLSSRTRHRIHWCTVNCRALWITLSLEQGTAEDSNIINLWLATLTWVWLEIVGRQRELLMKTRVDNCSVHAAYSLNMPHLVLTTQPSGAPIDYHLTSCSNQLSSEILLAFSYICAVVLN